MSGDQNAYVYVLPEDHDQAETALVIENLRDCEQFMCDDEKDSSWWVYKCAGIRRAPPWP